MHEAARAPSVRIDDRPRASDGLNCLGSTLAVEFGWIAVSRTEGPMGNSARFLPGDISYHPSWLAMPQNCWHASASQTQAAHSSRWRAELFLFSGCPRLLQQERARTAWESRDVWGRGAAEGVLLQKEWGKGGRKKNEQMKDNTIRSLTISISRTLTTTTIMSLSSSFALLAFIILDNAVRNPFLCTILYISIDHTSYIPSPLFLYRCGRDYRGAMRRGIAT